MHLVEDLKIKFENLEKNTVSDSFGAKKIPGKAPVFDFKPIIEWLMNNISLLSEEHAEFKKNFLHLKKTVNDDPSFKYIINSLGRFSFCIELTNLGITSTKMKTRWVHGNIIKTQPGTYKNYQGSFEPGEDERSSNFTDCLMIFIKSINLLVESPDHIKLFSNLSISKHRGTPYESVFGYIDHKTNHIHRSSNIKLLDLTNINWLILVRPIMRDALSKDTNGNITKVYAKILTKSYKTDRSQTGEVQTNRAKRWECLGVDFQFATIEECWSVEKKLLIDIVNFEKFPLMIQELLSEKGLLNEKNSKITVCPITLKPLDFNELLSGSSHGESKFQVGHLNPLKLSGKHTGDNIAWISDDGNRIQGSLTIHETKKMLIDIVKRMNGLVNR